MTDAMFFSVDDLAAHCREESGRLGTQSQGGLSPCWELFRRAMVEGDQQAWQALYVQYRRLVGKWGSGAGMELDDLVTEAFARFWQGAHWHDFTSDFPTMPAVMGFLKRCAYSLSIDVARRDQHQRRVQEALASVTKEVGDCPEDVALGRIFAEERQAYLRSRLRDDDEQLVFRATYELGLKPAEIARSYPQRFDDVYAVYRIKERILSRLAADPVLQAWGAAP